MDVRQSAIVCPAILQRPDFFMEFHVSNRQNDSQDLGQQPGLWVRKKEGAPTRPILVNEIPLVLFDPDVAAYDGFDRESKNFANRLLNFPVAPNLGR